MNLNRRLDQIQKRTPAALRRVFCPGTRDACDAAEPLSATIARWCEAHPGEPAPIDDSNTLFLIRTIVSPTHDPASSATPT